MNHDKFVHLHVHSDFSLLDGACKVETLARLAKQNKMRSLALTDHGNLFGAVQFYTTMLKAGVKPIIGYEAYVAPGSRKARHAPGGIKDASYHLTILAADLRGYQNLLKLASAAYLDGFYYRPRIDVELLQEHKDGLIVLSGCNSSLVCQLLLAGREKEARDAAATYADILGKENYFIELQDNGLTEQRTCLEGLVRIAQDLELQLVATNDIHYAAAEDAAAHEALLCIKTGKTMKDEGRMRFGSNEFYFKSAEEMIGRFGDFPGAIENTYAVAARCNVELDMEHSNFPHYEPPDGVTSEEYLRQLCEEGMKSRFGSPSREARERLEYELKVIEQMGYSSYFLIGWDIVHYAKGRQIPTGLRGSGVSSLVCYVLGLSDIEPMRYSLIFERFLDPQRREPPDLDMDFCEHRREEVLRYVKKKYGQQNTAQIITFGTMAARAVVRDVGRVLGWSVADVDVLAKRIPSGIGTTLDSALEQDTALRNDYENDARTRELLTYALKLEGLNRHASTHAAGVVIADNSLDNYIPLCKMNDVMMSQFAMNDLEKVGMLKMDLLGLRTLTVIDRTLDLVEKRTGKRLDLGSLPLDDAKTYELIGRGDTKSVFQLGSSGVQQILTRLKPKDMEDIIAVVAMYRPGPLQSGMVDDFIARRLGEKEIRYLHPDLEPILKDTCGVLVYQEQIMRVLNQLGGLSLADALSTIKAISKKRASEIEAREEAFLKGARKRGISGGVARELFSLIRNFAQYGFNRAHTTAYALLAYRTAYLKANYPMEFAAAGLTSEMSHSDKLKEHIRDCRERMKINILAPCVNEGDAYFTVRGEDGIQFGMAAVRNVGMRAVEAILKARAAGGTFKSIFDFCERVESASVNRQAAESLIKAGAFDSLPGHRAQKVAVLEDAMRVGARTQENRRRGQKSLFGTEVLSDAVEEQPLPPVNEWPLTELVRHEKEALGLRLSFNPLDRYEAVFTQLTTVNSATINKLSHGVRVIVGGEVVSVRPSLTRQGRSMARVELEDLNGAVRGIAFPETYQKFGSLLKEDAIVFMVGSVDHNTERAGVVIDEVIPVSEGRTRLTAAVKVELQRTGLDKHILEHLREICARYPGNGIVLLEIHMPDRHRVVIRAGRGVAVEPSETFGREVAQLLGEGHLQLIPRNPDRGNGNHRRSNSRSRFTAAAR